MMTKFKRAFVLILSPVVITLGGSIMGCNTIEGAGEDIERGGEEIQDAAE